MSSSIILTLVGKEKTEKIIEKTYKENICSPTLDKTQRHGLEVQW